MCLTPTFLQSGQLVPILFACEKGYITVVETLLKYGGAESLQKHNKVDEKICFVFKFHSTLPLIHLL